MLSAATMLPAGFGMTVHRADLTGDYEATVYDAARRLLAEGASPADMVTTHRNGVPSMSRGVVGTFHKMSRKYMPLYVAEFQFRYNNRENADIFGTAIKGC
jgi:ISXO2-like transposase domain